MSRAFLLAALGANVFSYGAQDDSLPLIDSHRAPVESLAAARTNGDERRATLSEMWQRRVLAPEARDYGPQDLELLARVRSAEAAGALGYLRRRVGNLSGYAVSRGAGPLRLTKEGWERFRLMRTQDALKYFEAKGVDAKWGFHLRDMKDRRLFDARGLLTPEGEELYTRALANLPVHWKTPNGEVFGNRPPPKAPAPPPEREPLPPPSMPGPRRAPQANPSMVPGAPEAAGAPVGAPSSGAQTPPGPPSQEPPAEEKPAAEKPASP